MRPDIGIKEEYKDRAIARLFEVYYGLPERILIADGKGIIIFASKEAEGETAGQIIGKPLALAVGAESALTLLQALARNVPAAASAMWAKKRCVLSMTPYDGCMVIFLNLSSPQDAPSVIDSNSVSFFEHEAKNTISVMEAALQSLRGKIQEQNDSTRDIALIRQGLMRMARLTGDFIDCAKLDLNRLQIDANVGNLKQCVSQTCDRLEQILNKLGIEFSAEIEQRAAVSAFDKNKIKHMIFNIVAACCEIDGVQNVKIRFGTEGGSAIIEIFAGYKQPHGADKFAANISETASCELEAAEYAGFGLMSAAAAATAHGGRMVRSESADGIKFVITMPLSADMQNMKFNSPFDLHRSDTDAFGEFSGLLGWEEYK